MSTDASQRHAQSVGDLHLISSRRGTNFTEVPIEQFRICWQAAVKHVWMRLFELWEVHMDMLAEKNLFAFWV